MCRLNNLGLSRAASAVAQQLKSLHAVQEMQEIRVQSLGQESPQEKEMTTYSSTHAWEILWTEEPGGLQRVNLDGVTNTLFSLQIEQFRFQHFRLSRLGLSWGVEEI